MTEEIPAKCCFKCAAWVQNEEQEDIGPDDFLGECHRKAPIPINETWSHEVLKHLTMLSWTVADEVQRKRDYLWWEEAAAQGHTCWPQTRGTEFCWEFVPQGG